MILLLALQVKTKSQILNIFYKGPRLHTLLHQNCGYKNPGGNLLFQGTFFEPISDYVCHF